MKLNIPETALAIAVINRAARDAIGRFGHCSWCDAKKVVESQYSREFLLGTSEFDDENEYSEFWFDLACLDRPTTFQEIVELAG